MEFSRLLYKNAPRILSTSTGVMPSLTTLHANVVAFFLKSTNAPLYPATSSLGVAPSIAPTS